MISAGNLWRLYEILFIRGSYRADVDGASELTCQSRYACSNHVMNGSCANSRTIAREALETRMLTGLRDRLMAPEAAAAAMHAYAEETNRLNREQRSSGEVDRKALADIEKKLKEIVTAIEDGGYSRPLMSRLHDLEAKQDELTERLSHAPVDIPDIHPNVAGIYRRKVERLAEALQRPQERDEAAEAIRALIERITLTPGPKRGQIDATLHGDFRTILEWTTQKQNTPGAVASGVSVSVVAGACNHIRSSAPNCDQALPPYAFVRPLDARHPKPCNQYDLRSYAISLARNTRFLRLIERAIPTRAA